MYISLQQMLGQVKYNVTLFGSGYESFDMILLSIQTILVDINNLEMIMCE